jgi:type IX secretion system PorP/SprF family membrane protein
MIKKLLILFLLLPGVIRCSAQDPHFTQFFASPLTLNPAFTGLFSGDFRVAGNYRTQWGSIATPFITGTVSADFNILKNYINPNDIFGVGFLALYDQTGGGALQTNYFAASLAYQKSLDVDGRNTLGLGIQAALAQKVLDYTKLEFPDQLTSDGFDPNLPSGEDFPNSTITYPDYNVGLLYNSLLGNNSSIYFGGSYYHLNQPKESFLGGNYSLDSRITFHGGGSFQINKMARFYTSALFMHQGSAQEIDFGGAFGLLVNDLPETPTIFYIGTWYRYNDAINPYVGVEINNIQVGMTYDINVSSLTPASMDRGGFELSVIYIQPSAGPNLKRYKCPKF